MRGALLLALAAAPLFAQEQSPTQVDWIGDWDEALEIAQKTGRPIMVCINSKDGEIANERTAGRIYKDKEFVALTRRFVMVVASTLDHPGMLGPCTRFGRVTCKQHRDCEKRVRNTYADELPRKNGEMISPQHAFFTPAGTFLRRKEYELKRSALMSMMRRALKQAAKARKAEEADEPEEDSDRSNSPLTATEQARLPVIARSRSEEERRAADAALLATDKRAAVTALVDLLEDTAKPAVKCTIIRALGRAGATQARETIEGGLADKDDRVRNFCAVALEELAQQASVPALVKRCRREREHQARKNIYRALGACGGPQADKQAAKALLAAIGRDKQAMVRKHSAIAIKAYSATDKGRRLVKPKLESLVLREKDREVRGALVYALAYIGDAETTLPVLEKVLERATNDLAKGWVRDAIAVLKKRGDWRFGNWLWREDRNDPARGAEGNGGR